MTNKRSSLRRQPRFAEIIAMTKFWNTMRQIARPRLPGQVPILPCILMFLLTAAVIYAAGRSHWHAIPPTYTATAYVVEKASDARTPFSTTDADPRQAVEAANAQAARFAAEQQLQWRRNWEMPYTRAYGVLEQTRHERNDSEARLNAFERQRTAALTDADANALRHESPAAPTTIENPAWLDLQQQLSYLERRHDQLLVSRTPLHPAVLECEERLAVVRSKMALVSTKIPAETTGHIASADLPPAERLTTVEDQRKFAQLTVEVANKRAAFEAAEREVRQIAQKQQTGAQCVVQGATAVQNPVETDTSWQRLLWTMFAAGALMAFGVGSVALGANIEPPILSVEEVEDELGDAVIGIVPSAEPASDAAEIRQQMRTRRTAIAAGVLLMAACLVVAVSGVSGMN